MRRWKEDNLEAYARMCVDPEVMRYLPGTLTREQSEEQIQRFVRHWEEHDFGLWATEYKANGAFIGFIGLLYSEDWPEGEHKTEVGWRLDRAYWGRGLATEGARASIRYGFEKLGLERIISITVPENVASRRIMEKAGLTYRGETRWRGLDVVWYEIDRWEWEEQPGTDNRRLTG
ncbi:MAG: GNAT family N-acetyltransferase [Rubrobacteraceae bacterium]|nr:GNAT family N-acetyltransferase [Rubrobacteraceae bacterium]